MLLLLISKFALKFHFKSSFAVWHSARFRKKKYRIILPLAGIDLTLSGLCADKVALLLLLVDYNSWETTTPTFPHCFDETLT